MPPTLADESTAVTRRTEGRGHLLDQFESALLTGAFNRILHRPREPFVGGVKGQLGLAIDQFIAEFVVPAVQCGAACGVRLGSLRTYQQERIGLSGHCRQPRTHQILACRPQGHGQRIGRADGTLKIFGHQQHALGLNLDSITAALDIDGTSPGVMPAMIRNDGKLTTFLVSRPRCTLANSSSARKIAA